MVGLMWWVRLHLNRQHPDELDERRKWHCYCCFVGENDSHPSPFWVVPYWQIVGLRFHCCCFLMWRFWDDWIALLKANNCIYWAWWSFSCWQCWCYCPWWCFYVLFGFFSCVGKHLKREKPWVWAKTWIFLYRHHCWLMIIHASCCCCLIWKTFVWVVS